MAKSIIALIIVLFLAFSLTTVALAYVASSSSYRIEVDSLNVGGNQSSSTNYQAGDTAGEAASDLATSSSYGLKTGYRFMLDAFISLSTPSNVTLNSINGARGGTGTSSASWTVITDGSAGYALSVKAGTSPALKAGAESFADYAPAVAGTPDYTWSVAAGASEFGFSPEGSDLVQKYKDNGAACNAGSGTTANTCWNGFTTSNEIVAQSSSANSPTGSGTTLRFQAEVGSAHVQPAGDYAATITVTAVTN